ncbi:hypothetical protein [Streptomyces sp. NPDC002088]|uniref:hypothetical protein n=1 Tax=Streptomyces sp. NPDC002088 TaxID=3154665 RepID=UPI003331CDD0
MRVLVLEDDPELGPVVAAQLRDAGFAVDTVLVSAPSADGGQLRWAAAPVWDDDRQKEAVAHPE